LIGPEFILSEFIEDSDLKDKLQRHVACYMVEQVKLAETEATQDNETIILSHLIREGYASEFVYISDIKDKLSERYEWMTARFIGSVLKRLGFTNRRRAGPSGRTQVFIPEQELLESCMTYRIEIPEGKGYDLDYFSRKTPKTPSEPSEPSERSVNVEEGTTEDTEETEETEGDLDPKTKSGIAEESTQKRFFEIIEKTQNDSKEDQDRVGYEEFGIDYDRLVKHHREEGRVYRQNVDSAWRLVQ
jgi:hypothetical protein